MSSFKESLCLKIIAVHIYLLFIWKTIRPILKLINLTQCETAWRGGERQFLLSIHFSAGNRWSALFFLSMVAFAVFVFSIFVIAVFIFLIASWYFNRQEWHPAAIAGTITAVFLTIWYTGLLESGRVFIISLKQNCLFHWKLAMACWLLTCLCSDPSLLTLLATLGLFFTLADFIGPKVCLPIA